MPKHKEPILSAEKLFQVVSPATGEVVFEHHLAKPIEIQQTLERSKRASLRWGALPLTDRLEYLQRFVDILVSQAQEIGKELSLTIGRPISQASVEIDALKERALQMIALAPEALRTIQAGPGRRIDRVPRGVMLTIASWNYPYLTAIDSVIPALAAGNVVILKHSSQTAVCAERIERTFQQADLPDGVFHSLHLTHTDTEELITDGHLDQVHFIGSVAGGRAIKRAAASTFTPVVLGLGGKDPAYVRRDAPLEECVKPIAKGVFFNSGQSCSAIERIYVHHHLFDEFVDRLIEQARALKSGDPLDPQTNLGPLVSKEAADRVRRQLIESQEQGAEPLLKRGLGEGAYLPPEVYIDIHHGMSLMTEETFAPVVGVMPVDSDEEAVLMMNDCRYGLTASIWTADLSRAERLGKQLEVGTVYANCCDHLDAALAWSGIKDSGGGCTLSVIAYEQLTRPKSYLLQEVSK